MHMKYIFCFLEATVTEKDNPTKKKGACQWPFEETSEELDAMRTSMERAVQVE